MDAETARAILDLNGRYNGTVFHEPVFNEIASDVFRTELSYYAAYQKGELAGFCPVHSFRRGLAVSSFSNLDSYEVPYGGWIYDAGRVSLPELLKRTPLRPNEGLHMASSIERPPEYIYADQTGKARAAHTLLMALKGTSATGIFEGMNHKQRNKIRRAYKLGLEAKVIAPAEFGLLWDLMARLKERTGLPERDRSFYERIYTRYYDMQRSACLGAWHEGQCISAMLLLANANYAHAWVAGRLTEIPNNLYQNELLLWESILWAQQTGSACFDFCGLDEAKLPHLARIKLSFSQDVADFYFYGRKTFLYRLLGRSGRLK